MFLDQSEWSDPLNYDHLERTEVKLSPSLYKTCSGMVAFPNMYARILQILLWEIGNYRRINDVLWEEVHST